MQKCYLARLFVKESFQEQQLHQVSYANSALFSQNKDPEFWVLGGQEEWRRKRRKIFGEEKYFFEDEKKMGGGYLEQEITFWRMRRIEKQTSYFSFFLHTDFLRTDFSPHRFGTKTA